MRPGSTPAPQGLAFPPASIDDLPSVMRPSEEGGQLHHKGQVEVVSSLEPDGRVIPYDIRFGVWVVFEGETEYIRRCFTEYGVRTDPGGRYACLYKRWHLIGLEVGISVASVGLRGEPTGCATGFRADVVATAKRDSPGGRDARRRGRLHGVRQARPRRGVAERGRPTARARARREARQPSRGRGAGAMGRRPDRRRRAWRCGSDARWNAAFAPSHRAAA